MLNERTYCVYMHKNKINGKVYIGATCSDVKRRWEKGALYKGNKDFYEDILKYGWDNFEHIILENNLNNESAKVQEKLYIKTYKDNCYNKTKGGELGKVKHLTDEEYKKAYRNKIQKQIKKQKEHKVETNKYERNYYNSNENYHQYKIEYQRKYRYEHRKSNKPYKGKYIENTN